MAKSGMRKLIEALEILEPYTGAMQYPTSCEHDVLYVFVDPKTVSKSDLGKLERRGFEDSGVGSFKSERFG